jgi:DNA polymerase-1
MKLAVSEDAHTGMGATIYDVPFSEVTKEQRSVGKTVNFAIVYEVSAVGLAPRLTEATGTHWEVDDAQSLIDSLKSKFPSLTKWKKFVEWHVKKYGYMTSPLGRRRYFPTRGADDREIREAINFPIQSMASDMMLIGLINLNRLLKERGIDAWAINEVHDALVVECRDDELLVKEVASTLKDAMLDLRWPNSKEEFNWLSVPIKVDIEVGYNMGNMKGIEV